jgi:hypothetical protein
MINWITQQKKEKEKREITKEEMKYQEQIFGRVEDDDDLGKVSKIVKVKEVQNIRLQDYCKECQAILINPKWRINQDCLEEMKTSQKGDKSQSTADANNE